jgi:type IV pilus assembly protein PilC
MPAFRCKYMTPQGKYLKKVLTADSKEDLRWRLEREGHFVYRIKRAGRLRPNSARPSRGGGFKTTDFLSFNKEFAVLLRTGIPVVAALDAITEKSAPGEFLEVLRQVRYDVSTGQGLSEAFAKYPHQFSNIYVSALQAGERSGNIPEALLRHIDYMKKARILRRKMITAAVYPVILTVTSIFVLGLLMVYVVPAFTKTYFDAGTELPWLTRVLVDTSQGLKANILLLLALCGLAAAGLYLGVRNEATRPRLDQIRLNLPVVGAVQMTYATAQLFRTVATILGSGTPLLEAMRIATGSQGNYFLRDRLQEVVGRLEEGAMLSEALEEAEVFPRLAVRMVSAGESGGALEQVLGDVADFYDDELENRLNLLTSAVEPVLMLIMGLLIGFIVVAMYLPIFQLAGTAF